MKRLGPSLGLLIAFAVGCAPPGNNGDDDGLSNIPCDQETRDDDYVAGLAKTGLSNVVFTQLDDALPAPPDVGFNTWELTAFDVVGSASQQGCTITATPFMPDHGHGTSPVSPTLPETSPGVYSTDQLNFFMGGYWEITFQLDCPVGTDQLVYAFCMEG